MLRLANDIRSVSRRKSIEEGIVYIYESDFSSDVDGWSGIVGVDSLAAPASVGGENNALLLTCNEAAGKATKSIIEQTVPTTTIGQDYEVTLDYYVLSTNDEVFYLESVQFSTVLATVDSSAVPTNTWLSRTVTFTATRAETSFRLNMNKDNVTGVADKVYFKNITYREI